MIVTTDLDRFYKAYPPGSTIHWKRRGYEGEGRVLERDNEEYVRKWGEPGNFVPVLELGEREVLNGWPVDNLSEFILIAEPPYSGFYCAQCDNPSDQDYLCGECRES